MLSSMLLALLVLAPQYSLVSCDHPVQPFFLSALSNALTADQAQYIGRFPLAVINHKQASGDSPRSGGAETKQLAALQAIKAANSSCQTIFYLNSQIDFPELALHSKFVQNPQWWLKDDAGKYVYHGADHFFDWTQQGAQNAWLATASAVLSQPFVDGIFCDKAMINSTRNLPNVSTARTEQWNKAHQALLVSLRASTSKQVVLNNEHFYNGIVDVAGMGQLFERWGQFPLDHDNLTVTQDMEVLAMLNANNLTALARAGGASPSTHHGTPPDPTACGAGLAEFLVTITNPVVSFFSCVPSFASTATTGWMTLLSDPIYSQPLGTPLGAAVTDPNGVVHRNFSSGTVAYLNPNTNSSGCVIWGSKMVNGTCPHGVLPSA